MTLDAIDIRQPQVDDGEIRLALPAIALSRGVPVADSTTRLLPRTEGCAQEAPDLGLILDDHENRGARICHV